MNKKTYLHHKWRLKIIKSSGSKLVIPGKISNKWIPAVVPGTIHTDLLKAGFIKNPFLERNEYKFKWISSNQCIYLTEFDYPEIEIKKSFIKLVFEGIDTVADIYLNKKHLGKTENMFLKYEFNVSQILKPQKNILELHFRSPLRMSQEIAKKYDKSHSLDSTRVYLRKAQYSFGWDWGPSYPTMGIWRPVYLLSEGQAFITKIKFDTEKISSQKADVKVSFNVCIHTKKKLKALVSLYHDGKELIQEMTVKDQSEYNLRIRVTDPELWWPHGLGQQNLYELRIRLIDDKGKILDKKSKQVGIRKIDLQQREEDKAIFRFKVNNKPIYIRGMNWIPADSFLPRVSEKKYRKLLTLAKYANANMIRVWGGGIYESDAFYDLCDELGLLVWQDFMFACGNYPEGKQFINSVYKEIVQNVERLMSHPSISVWCGNNENEWIWFQTEKKSYREMPGYKIFHQLIPDTIKKIGTSIPYRPTSPFGEEDDPNSQNSGNTHQWDIWSHWVDYTQVKNDQSLFVTEFGFQAPANIDTFKSVIPATKRNIQSSAFEYYNKQIEGPERVVRFLTTHLPLTTKWEDFIYLAQLNQGLALRACVEHWRTNKRNHGSIIWQLNDCWPVTSWSLIDSDIKPKISYHFVKNIFSKELIYFRKTNNKLKVLLLNEDIKSEIVYKRITIDSKSGRYLNKYSKKISPRKKEYIELDNLNISKLPENKDWIILTTVYDRRNEILQRNFYKEKEWKYLEIPEADISIKNEIKPDGNHLLLNSNKPVFFVDLYYPGKTFSDRGFIMLPGENKQLEITGGKSKEIKINKIKIFCLNNYLHN